MYEFLKERLVSYQNEGARCYYIVLTRVPARGLDMLSMDLSKFFNRLLKDYPDSSYFCVVTTQGNGTVHLIVSTKRFSLDKRWVQRWWSMITGANIVSCHLLCDSYSECDPYIESVTLHFSSLPDIIDMESFRF